MARSSLGFNKKREDPAVMGWTLPLRPEQRRLWSSQLKCHRGQTGQGAEANFSPSGVLSYHFHSWKAPPE